MIKSRSAWKSSGVLFLLIQRDVTRGMGARRRPFVVRVVKNRWDRIVDKRQGLISEQVLNYAKSTAETIDSDVKTVLRSKPAKNFRDKIWLDK